MQKGQAITLAVVCIVIIIATLASTRYKLISILLGRVGVIDNSSEKYCHQFGYRSCPITCSVSPSCPICEDIGCHVKGGHSFKRE